MFRINNANTSNELNLFKVKNFKDIQSTKLLTLVIYMFFKLAI